MKTCPNCDEAVITTGQVVRSAIGIGFEPKCNSCLKSFTVGKKWQGNFTGLLILAFVISVTLSISHKSYIPYLLMPMALAINSIALNRFATLKPFSKTKVQKYTDIFLTLIVIASIFWVTYHAVLT